MLNETIWKRTYPTVTQRGRTFPDYSQTPTELAISGCDIQPGASTEMAIEHRQGTAIRYTVYCPATAPLDAGSVVRVRSDLCQVDGDPMVWDGPLSHMVVYLVSWEPRA